jgi:hypothetical protein
MKLFIIFMLMLLAFENSLHASPDTFNESEESSQSSTPSTQPFNAHDVELNEAFGYYDHKFPVKCGQRPQPDDKLREEIEKALEASLPEDLWQFYCRFWNRPAKTFELYDIWLDLRANIIYFNEWFHGISDKPKTHIAFSDENRGDYYVIDDKGAIHYWCPDKGDYSEKETDKWPSFAAWLKYKMGIKS